MGYTKADMLISEDPGGKDENSVDDEAVGMMVAGNKREQASIW
jgi:hypothetical protein